MAKKTEKAEAAEAGRPAADSALAERVRRGDRARAWRRSWAATNPLSLPRLEKIVVNMGVGSAITEKKHMEDAVAALTQITGQKPLVDARAARRSPTSACAKDMEIGCKVTLRGTRMYEFLDRLISLALPRVRDFRGLNPKASTATATTAWACRSSWCFPELNPDKFTRVQGMNITIVMSSRQQRRSRASCCEAFGMPFKAEEAARRKAAA